MGTLYECYETGIICEKSCLFPARFSTVKKYDFLYQEELPHFLKMPLHIYGLPYSDKPEKMYLGLGRMGLTTPPDKLKLVPTDKQKELISKIKETSSYEEELMIDETDANMYLGLFQDGNNHELIWSRISGSTEIIPIGYRFLGYDVSYPPYCDGAYSIICDCMFICKWHGCDEEGKLFAEDFEKLNDNGLFPDWQSAYHYMVKCLNEDWTERGEYGIFEIYSR